MKTLIVLSVGVLVLSAIVFFAMSAACDEPFYLTGSTCYNFITTVRGL